MPRDRAVSVGALDLIFTALCGVFVAAQGPQGSQGPRPPKSLPPEVFKHVASDGSVRVIVELRLDGGSMTAEGRLPAAARAAQRKNISDAADRVWAGLPRAERRMLHRYQTLPYLAVEVGPNALAALTASPDVAR